MAVAKGRVAIAKRWVDIEKTRVEIATPIIGMGEARFGVRLCYFKSNQYDMPEAITWRNSQAVPLLTSPPKTSRL